MRTRGLKSTLSPPIPADPTCHFPPHMSIFGDGGLVIVDVPGHAVGQVGMVVNLSSRKRFFLTGDSFYFPDSLERRAPKSRIMQAVSKEEQESAETLEKLWRLTRDEADIELVSCHDYRIPGRFELAPVTYE